MLYKPTSPSPYAECIALDDTDANKIQFSCSMIGGDEVETARLKISDGNTQYYFDTQTNIIPEAKIEGTITEEYKISREDSASKILGTIYVYPIKAGYTYTIICRNNNAFRLCYYASVLTSGITTTELEVIKYDDNLSSFEYKNTRNDGYLYINFSTNGGLSNENIIVVEKQSSVSEAFNLTTTESNTRVEFNIEGVLSYAGYTITNAEAPIRSSFVNTPLSNIITSDKEYIWQTRLYEKGSLTDDNHRSNIWLGYGVIESLNLSGTTSGQTNESNYYYIGGQTYDLALNAAKAHRICIRVRPHTNIYFPKSTGGTTFVSKDSKDIDIQKLFNYYDDNARYYIKVNGRYYPIRDYRFYPPTLGEDETFETWKASTFNDCFDNYGEPLYGYIVLDYTYTDADNDGSADDKNNPIINVGDQYEIYCNYVDSDEYYFNVVEKPTLTFTETKGEIIDGTEDSPIDIEYSNLNLVGVYNHPSGAKIEKYNVVLYKNESTDVESKDWKIIDQTEDIYSSSITYSYDMLMNGNNYRIVVTIHDNLGYKFEKSLFIKVVYPVTDVYKTDVVANYYNKHDSIVIDWSSGNFGDVHHFEVYKKIGNNSKLHKVYSTSSWKECIVEDFAVGNLCDYKYIVYPVYSHKTNEASFYRISNPSESNVIKHNYGAATILGLVQDTDDLNTYTIDYTEMWRFEFNLENSGTTLNMDKTFTDTQHRFPKMSGGSRKYNTTSVKGLIGYYDCEKDDYTENYDLLEDWENFCANNKLKLLKDRRGRLIPCEIESTSFEYMDVSEAPAIASFNARQLESLDNITILGRPLIINPVKYKLLTDSNDAILTDIDINDGGQILTSQES